MGYRITIVGKDVGTQLDRVLLKKEVTTIEEALEEVSRLIPNVYNYDSIREIDIAKVKG
jgi:hypothetical protein